MITNKTTTETVKIATIDTVPNLADMLSSATISSVSSTPNINDYVFKADYFNSLGGLTMDGVFNGLSQCNCPVCRDKCVTKMTLPVIKEVIYHDKTHTTIRWEDDTATDVSCGEGEQYNEYEGFCAAIVKKLFGGTGAAKRVMFEKNLTEQRRIAKEEEAKKRQEEAEKSARKKARSKKRYLKKMAKKMLLEEEARELAKKMREGK